MKKVTIKEFDEYILKHKLSFKYVNDDKIYWILHDGIDNTLPGARVLFKTSYSGKMEDSYYEFYIKD